MNLARCPCRPACGRDRLVACEAGTRLVGSQLAAYLLDELFLTQPGCSPAGVTTCACAWSRAPPCCRVHREARLLSVRRSHDHVFLRYQLCPT